MEGTTNVIARSLYVCGSNTECGNGGDRVKYTPMKFNPDICRISPFTEMPNEFRCKPYHAECLYDRWITLALRLSFAPFYIFFFYLCITDLGLPGYEKPQTED